MSENKYRIKNPNLRLVEIPRAAILVLKKYGWRSFIGKSFNFFLLKLGLTQGTGRMFVSKERTAKEVYWERFRTVQPMRYVKVKRIDPRFNIVTDSLKKDSLFGGVATALILGILYARKNNMPLRIVTREADASPADFENFLELMGLEAPNTVEYFSDYDRVIGKKNHGIETSEEDIYMSTSWWTTIAIENINLRKCMFYILQEIETFFYPSGDEQLMCLSTLNRKDVKYIVNSKLLFDYYGENNYKNVIDNGRYFEPAFQKEVYFSRGLSQKNSVNKYKLFFYARPNNPRNLYYTGLKILENAISSGIISKDEWEIYFAGSQTDKIIFSGDWQPIFLGQMSWHQYTEFVKSVDLGLCLMATPHPSYPPLDIAACGGVVLTNKFMNKKSLDNYSKNIICAGLNGDSMLNGFSEAVNLAKNTKKRGENFSGNGIIKKWEESLGGIIEFIDENK